MTHLVRTPPFWPATSADPLGSTAGAVSPPPHVLVTLGRNPSFSSSPPPNYCDLQRFHQVNCHYPVAGLFCCNSRSLKFVYVTLSWWLQTILHCKIFVHSLTICKLYLKLQNLPTCQIFFLVFSLLKGGVLRKSVHNIRLHECNSTTASHYFTVFPILSWADGTV